MGFHTLFFFSFWNVARIVDHFENHVLMAGQILLREDSSCRRPFLGDEIVSPSLRTNFLRKGLQLDLNELGNEH